MSARPEQGYTARLAGHGDPLPPAADWSLEMLDEARGIARLTDGRRTVTLAVEGSGTDWQVTIRGRRVPITVRSWREEVLARASGEAAQRAGPLELRASLPGLIVAIEAEEGSEVAQGDPLLRIEAMKMQNELRAPRQGRIGAILVVPGQAVTTGEVLLRLE